MLQELEAAHHPARVPHERLEERELLGESSISVSPRHRSAAAQDRAEASPRELRGPLGRTAADQGSKACEQFRVRERLGEVVVGTRIQAFNPIPHRVSGSQHQNGRPDAGFTKRAADLEAVEAREHDVEHDRVVLGGLTAGERLWPLADDVDGHALFSKPALEEARKLALVFRDENPHVPAKAPFSNVKAR